MVRYDYRVDRPAPLSDPFIAAIEAHEGRALR
jgi:hypothetical protein